ncbi:MAG: hypothetical protein ACMUIG_09555 [Thermoplasmatota archaeon]
MEKKFLIIIIVGVVLAVLAGGGILVFAMSGGEGGSGPEIPGISSFPEQRISFSIPDEGLMINDGSTVYFPIVPNGTDVILLSNVQAGITWSDDEVPPAWRVTYQNEPDTMTMRVVVMSESGEENDTLEMESTSETGAVNIMFNMAQKNGVVKGEGGANWSFPEAGETSLSGNATFYISVSCEAGMIRSTRPALLLYTDRGDEIGMDVEITYRQVPLEIYEYWQKESEAAAAEQW